MDIKEELIEKKDKNTNSGFKLTTPVAILIGFILLAVAVFFGINKNNTPKEFEPSGITKEILKIKSDDQIQGDKNAQIAVITYADSDCPYCEKFHYTMEEVIEKDKEIVWVYRHLPLENIHPNAFNEAIALECAAQIAGPEAFWQYLKQAMPVTMDPSDPSTPDKLLAMASSLGIESEEFKSCFNQEDIQNKISSHMSEAANAGAQGTPFSIVVNQKTKKYETIPGAASFDQTMQKINSLR